MNQDRSVKFVEVNGIKNTAIKVINFLMFQIGWFVCVLLQDKHFVAYFYTLAAIVVHGFFVVETRREWLGILSVVCVGVLADTVLGFSGVLVFQSGLLVPGFLVPLWLICIWILFATTLAHSLSWLKDKLWLAGILSAIAGPLSYVAGSRLSQGVVELGDPLFVSVVFLCIFWCSIVPLGFTIMKRLGVFSR